MHATGPSNSGMPDDIASLTARTGFRRWPWPSLLPFRDDEPDIVGLITRTVGDQSSDVLKTLKDGGIRVCAVIRRDDSGPAAPDAGCAAPLVSVLWMAARELGRNDSAVRFPRIRLVARLAALALNNPDAEPADVLREKLWEIWSTRDGTAAPQENILVTTFQRWPYPFALLGDLAALLVWSQFRLWFRGTPGLGPEFRWLRRQRKYLLPDETFETFLLRLTGSVDVERLAAQAFLEDLRVSYQPRRWNWGAWNRNRRPVLILDNPGNSLPGLFDEARTFARRQGAKPDPLLIVLVPWSDGQPHDFRLRVVHQVGEPQHVRYPQPNHPLRALLAMGAAPLCILAVAVIVALRAAGVLGALPWPGPSSQALLLSYPSANRDEEVFDDPFRFDVGRDPNRHLAFGFGVHFCLGAALARMETRALFGELLPRLESIELIGRPEWAATTFVGGLKHLPIRYSLKG